MPQLPHCCLRGTVVTESVYCLGHSQSRGHEFWPVQPDNRSSPSLPSVKVSASVIDVNTWITTRLPTAVWIKNRQTFPGWLTHSGQFTHKVVTCQPYRSGAGQGSPPAWDHWVPVLQIQGAGGIRARRSARVSPASRGRHVSAAAWPAATCEHRRCGETETSRST